MDEEWMNLKYTKSYDNFNENQNAFMVSDFFYLPNQWAPYGFPPK